MKPIFTVGINRIITPEELHHIQRMLSEQLLDYHVLAYKCKGDNIKFDLFNSDEIKDIDLEGLKK